MNAPAATRAPDTRFNARVLYDVYAVTIAVRNRIIGGMPKNKALIANWVAASRPKGEPEDPAKTQELIEKDLELIVDEVTEKMYTGFPEDSEGIMFPCRNIKSMLKQSASVLKLTVQKRGSKQILCEGMEVKAPNGGEYVRIGKEPSGAEETAIHVMTAQGPRTALKKYDFVSQPILKFEIWVLKTAAQETRHIGEDDLIKILTHAQENGVGASRSTGEGKFDVVEFSKIS